MKSAWKVCAMLLLATGLVAQTSTAGETQEDEVAGNHGGGCAVAEGCDRSAAGGAGAAATADSGTAR